MSEERNQSTEDSRTASAPASGPGRAFSWLERPGAANRRFWGLVVFAALFFLAGFSYEPYGYFAVEKFGGFYAIFGFVAIIALSFGARALQALTGRPEDYYGDKAVDSEAFPPQIPEGPGRDDE